MTSEAGRPNSVAPTALHPHMPTHSIIWPSTQMAAWVSCRGSCDRPKSSGWSRQGPSVLARPLRVHAASGTAISSQQ